MTSSKSIAERTTEGQRELLARLLRKQAGEKRAHPLSFAQQRIWFLNQLESTRAVFNIPSAVRLTGELDLAALELSLAEIVRRHETLRTTFSLTGEELKQIVAPEVKPVLTVEDLSGLPVDERQAEVLARASSEARRPFDLERGPLIRIVLFKLSNHEHVLVTTLHHIISDGWSVAVFIREMVALYAAFTANDRSPLAELPIQYADYARWQRERLSGKALEQQLEYWRRQLEGAPPVLELPTDQPRPAMQSFRAAKVPLWLPAKLTEGLKQLSQTEGATLFMTLLAAFNVLLERYTNQKDLTVGTPAANRNRTETEGLIGLFVNTLVLRTSLAGDPTFRELLGRVRETALGAYAHADVPFERLVEEMRPARDLSYTPLFQVMFALQPETELSTRVAGLNLERIELPATGAQFDLTLAVQQTAAGMTGMLEYNADLFEMRTAKRVVAHFARVLEAAVADPDQRISDLPLMTDAELHQVLVDWNNTSKQYPSHLSVHELFEEQASRTPDGVALELGGERLSYSDLNGRANQLARHLRAASVAPEDRVGILLEPGFEMLVALLGVLKAGAAYVPLDPLHPRERLSFMLEDSGAKLLITRQHSGLALPEVRLQTLFIDQDPEAIARQSARNLDIDLAADNLAYVIYTSGSTGRPKGTMIEHRALTERVRCLRATYGLGVSDRLLQFVSLSFDAAAEEIFPTLTSGACLVLQKNPMEIPPAEFLKHCERLGITVLHVPPSYWNKVVDDMNRTAQEVPASVRLFITGGESVTADSIETWASHSTRPAKLVIAYGPTETTITSLLYELSLGQGDEIHLNRPCIGRPVANTQVYILDPGGRPVPTGVAAELYVGGAGLARGYLDRPDLTADRFVPDQFSAEPGARLYRTGDLVRYAAGGRIEFMGRLDHQVKIRGHRIELGEVEATIRGHSEVRDCVVTARRSATGAQQLAAYVVVREPGGAVLGQLRSFLREALPEYMVPSQFVLLDELPLTPGGKVDRRALPEPGVDVVGAEAREYTAPRTQTERELAGVWADVLAVKQVGLDDNFFDLGGHSMLLAQVHGKLRDALGHDLSIVEMFQYPTVRSLAARISRGRDESGPVQRDEDLEEALRDGKERRKRTFSQRQRAAEVLGHDK
jgi:amino acid adenylation domain-containing protein